MPLVKKFILISALLVGIGNASQAQETTIPANATVLHLSETVERKVPRDRLRAELAVEAVDADAAKVQAEINRRMTAALARIKAVPEITVETNGYNVFEDRSDKAAARWRGSQSVSLTAKDFAKLLALIGSLQQDGLVMRGLAPDLSREARQAVEDELTDAATTRLQQRADHIAAGLGMRVERLRDLRVGNVAVPPAPLRAMALVGGAAATPPAAEPGEATVSVAVEADVMLTKHP